MSSIALYKALTSAGADEREARAAADDVADKGNIATRADIAELRADIAELRTELKTDIAELRTELKGDIATLKGDVGGIYRHMWFMAAGLVAIMVTLRLFDA